MLSILRGGGFPQWVSECLQKESVCERVEAKERAEETRLAA